MSRRGSSWIVRPHQLPLALALGLLLVLSGLGLDSASAHVRSRLLVSSSSDRSAAVPLGGSTVHGRIYVFVTSPRLLDRVEFYLDDPGRAKRPVGVDTKAPFDFAGTGANRKAQPYDTAKLAKGSHTITVVLRSGRSSTVRSATFRVDHGGTTPTPGWPSAPPARICGDTALLNGPARPPVGAIVVPAGDNVGFDFARRGATYWFAPGLHTLGNGEFNQISPSDDTTLVGGPGAILDGRGKNRYALTGKARGVTISHLTVRNFVAPMNEGTVNHDSGENWTMQYNTVVNNGGAGIFVGAGNVASYNCLKDNSQYGFQAYGSEGGESNIVLDHNEIVGNNTGDWEAKIEGCGCTGGGKFWDVRNVRVTNNYVHDNKSVALWADTNGNNFLFEGNWIENNDGQAIFYEISYNAAIRNNVIRYNLQFTARLRIRSGDNFPDAAIYISESGGDARLPYDLVGSPTIDISNNLIEDNYNGVALWENADRFCGSAANTSTGYCTLVNPSVAKLSTCTAANIAKEPYYSDCRWKTQNVNVHHNTFKMNPANFLDCPAHMCGRNAIFSNYGSFPSWSPYQDDKVCRAITFNQSNVFRANTYVGTWSFTVHDTGQTIPSAVWRAAPYRQDAGSTLPG